MWKHTLQCKAYIPYIDVLVIQKGLILRVVDSNRKLYISQEIRRIFGLEFTCVDVTSIIEAVDNIDYAGSILADIQHMQSQADNGIIFIPTFRILLI